VADEERPEAHNPRFSMKAILFLITLILSARAADLPRVAVVPDSPEPSVAAFADFLSVSLASSSNQYVLVERAEITRLASEAEIQKLAADQRPTALAKLAQADGLIIVGTDKGDPKLPKLTLRLTSTNNGLVLRSLILGSKEAEFSQAAELAAGVLRFPCERLTHGDAKPPIIISLLGIRPAFEIDRALETTLNLAVAQQLSAQSGIAVSERWKMNDLIFERSLADEKPQAFATGSILLDGSYTRKDDNFEVALRLRKSESDEGKKLELKGLATKPTELAQQIAKLVAAESGQAGEAAVWNPLEEAKQYKELGWWLQRRNQGRASARAYESAVALGLSEGWIICERITAYQSIIDDVNTHSRRVHVSEWNTLPKSEFKEIISIAIRLTQVTNEAVHAKWGDDFDKNFGKSKQNFILNKTFDLDLQLLQALCVRREQLELATEARRLRSLCRELLSIGEPVVGKFSSGFDNRFYIFETPADAVENLRYMLSLENLAGGIKSLGQCIRRAFWRRKRELPRFVDWSSATNLQGDAAWVGLIARLRTSNTILEQADGLAFAFQTSGSYDDKEKILSEFIKLLKSNENQLLTPQGQSLFASFAFFPAREDKRPYPNFEQGMMRILHNMLDQCDWLEAPAVEYLYWSWPQAGGERNILIPEAEAAAIVSRLETYVARARKDPRWKARYSDIERERLLEIATRIIAAYPRLKEQRIKPRTVVAGAVPIHAWTPEGPRVTDWKSCLVGDAMISSGDSLLVPRYDQGIIDLDVKTMKVKHVYDFPEPPGRSIGALACNERELMICINDHLHVRSLSANGNAWRPVELPSVTSGDRLYWCIRGMGDSFFVGSCLSKTEVESPRTLVGNFRDGKTTWVSSSNRRPALNPLDSMNPRTTALAYRTTTGKTMVLLDDTFGRAPLIELDSGREVASVRGGGIAQMRGEIPLYWHFAYQGIESLVACDPAKEQPDVVLRSGRKWQHYPQHWNNVNVISDTAAPEFRGKFIAAIVHGGKLWMLKREPEVPEKFEKNDPDGLRLVRCGMDGKQAVSIPLHYDVPEAIRALGRGKYFLCSLDKPTINARSLTATPKGLFFASSGYEASSFESGLVWSDGRASGGDPVPVLLYITWDDINAWLAKNAPEPAQPAAP